MKSYNELKLNILEQTSDKSVVFTFGRFQPPTSGHQLLIDKVIKEASKRRAEHRIYPSHSQDSKQNPLSHKDKVLFMRKMFSKANIVDDTKAKTPYHVLESLSKEGYKKVYFIVGGDRVSEFKNGMKKYVGKDGYDFDVFEVLSAGRRDPDAEGVVGMSGSKMRKAAEDNDFEKFTTGVPDKTPKRVAQGLFKAIRKGMGLKESYQLDEELIQPDNSEYWGTFPDFGKFEQDSEGGDWYKWARDDDGFIMGFTYTTQEGTEISVPWPPKDWDDTDYLPEPGFDDIPDLTGNIGDQVRALRRAAEFNKKQMKVESYQLDEVQTKFKVGDKVKYKGKVGTITKVGSGGTQWPGLVIYLKMKNGKKVSTMAKDLIKESYQLDEADNTASVAKQVKKAVKKYTKGKLTVKSKGGKTRFIMVSADNIDNKLRKMMLDVAYPKANVRGGDLKNISYGNISDKIISASVDHWVKALGLKESYLYESHMLGKTVIVGGKKGVVTKFLGDDFGEMYQVKLEDGTVITSPVIEMESIDESFENMLTELSMKESYQLDELNILKKLKMRKFDRDERKRKKKLKKGIRLSNKILGIESFMLDEQENTHSEIAKDAVGGQTVWDSLPQSAKDAVMDRLFPPVVRGKARMGRFQRAIPSKPLNWFDLIGRMFESNQLDESYSVVIVDDPQKRAKGLMFETSLDNGKGMLFVFDEENYHGIWMKDTLIPLDVVWINENMEIVDIQTLQPHDLKGHSPARPARYVLEVNANTFVGEVGDILDVKELDTIQSLDESFENYLTELSIQARRKMSRSAKRSSKRRARVRERKSKRMKSSKDIIKKSRQAAISGFKKKMLKGQQWSTLSHSVKANIEQRLKKKYSPARIAKVAAKLMPGIRSKERERIAGLRKKKTDEQFDAFLDERNYRKEYDNYQGKPDQIERRSSRNKARRAMEKDGKVCKGDGLDVDHKDRNPLNNHGGNLQAVDAGENRSFDRTDESKFYQGKRKAMEIGTTRARKIHTDTTPGQHWWMQKKWNIEEYD